MKFNTIQEIKNILKSKIFTILHDGSCLFEDDTYAILPGNIGLFIKRKDIVWTKINPKHNYSILQDGTTFILKTYKNEIHSKENEFILSIKEHLNGAYTVTLLSPKNKTERLRLLSE